MDTWPPVGRRWRGAPGEGDTRLKRLVSLYHEILNRSCRQQSRDGHYTSDLSSFMSTSLIGI